MKAAAKNFHLPKSAPALRIVRPRPAAGADSQARRNFAAIAQQLATTRRRSPGDEWWNAFRAGAAKYALHELNHSGAITHSQYRALDAWIMWGSQEERRKAKRKYHRLADRPGAKPRAKYFPTADPVKVIKKKRRPKK